MQSQSGASREGLLTCATAGREPEFRGQMLFQTSIWERGKTVAAITWKAVSEVALDMEDGIWNIER